jgi:hypothetical protein
MYPRRDDKSGLYGYWADGGWFIDPRFEYAHTFQSGYAVVQLNNVRYGLIGKDGTVHPLDGICGGRTPIRNEYSFSGFVDWNDEPSRYAAVCTNDRGRRQWGLIDTSLSYIPLPDEVVAKATRVASCGEYVVVVCKSRREQERSCGLFKLSEMRLELPCYFSCIYPSRGPSKESIWVVSRPMRDTHNKRDFAFYDLNKREIISDWFFGALPFSCGLGAIAEQEQGGRGWYFVDETLQPVFDGEFDGVDRFSLGLAGVYDGTDVGYIDTTGRMRLLLSHYVDLKPFNAFGLAIANRDGLDWDIDIIDRTGRPRVSGLQTAVYWDGDFPHFEVSRNGMRGRDGEVQFLAMNLDPIF